MEAYGWRHVPMVSIPSGLFRYILPFFVAHPEYGLWERVDAGPATVEK